MFGCKHVFGEIKDGYQYCTKCNKAIIVECSHSWETIDNLESFILGNLTSIIYIQRCKKCGKIKSTEISPEWRD
jgi:hypothetical protein